MAEQEFLVKFTRKICGWQTSILPFPHLAYDVARKAGAPAAIMKHEATTKMEEVFLRGL